MFSDQGSSLELLLYSEMMTSHFGVLKYSFFSFFEKTAITYNGWFVLFEILLFHEQTWHQIQFCFCFSSLPFLFFPLLVPELGGLLARQVPPWYR